MKTMFYNKKGDASIVSNHKVEILGSDEAPEKVSLTEAQYKKVVTDRTHNMTLGEDKKPVLAEVPANEKQVAREALKTKLEAGTATAEDKDEVLKLLL